MPEAGVDKKLVVRPANTRSAEQRRVMQEATDDGICPFCPEHLQSRYKGAILEKGAYWALTTNGWPYKGSKRHYVAILNRHVSILSELTDIEGAELVGMFRRVCVKEGITGGAMAIRFGNHPKLKNSISHLHAHLIEPDVEDPNMPDIKFSISKNNPNT
ncbi:MAG: hypothetical protein AAB573_02795 [Patescibacteria group bacterium]